jgi:hypothetical protein
MSIAIPIFKQQISNTKCFVMFSNLLYSLKSIYVQCLEEVFYTLMKDFVEICEQFNVCLFHELNSNFVTFLNADASLKCYAFISFLLMFCFKTSPLCFEFCQSFRFSNSLILHFSDLGLCCFEFG